MTDGSRNEIGARRWLVEWCVLPPNTSIHCDELELDSLHYKVTSFNSQQAAITRAQEAVKEDYFGSVAVKEQRVEWLVQLGNVACWEDVGPIEYVETGD